MPTAKSIVAVAVGAALAFAACGGGRSGEETSATGETSAALKANSCASV